MSDAMTDNELMEAIVAISKKIEEDSRTGDMKQLKKDMAESKRLQKLMDQRSAEIEKRAKEEKK